MRVGWGPVRRGTPLESHTDIDRVLGYSAENLDAEFFVLDIEDNLELQFSQLSQE